MIINCSNLINYVILKNFSARIHFNESIYNKLKIYKIKIYCALRSVQRTTMDKMMTDLAITISCKT